LTIPADSVFSICFFQLFLLKSIRTERFRFASEKKRRFFRFFLLAVGWPIIFSEKSSFRGKNENEKS